MSLRKTTFARHMLRQLVGLKWGSGAKTLLRAVLSLVYITAEYFAPIWSRSVYTCLIDRVLNDSLRIVTGCLSPTPTDHLLILLSIQPAELHRLRTTDPRIPKNSVPLSTFLNN